MGLEGRRHGLGVWIQDSEGAKFWQNVVTDLSNRRVRDILIAGCDGLPDAIRANPDTVVQTCAVHVIRNAMRFLSYEDRKKVATAMRMIYTPATVDAAELAKGHTLSADGSAERTDRFSRSRPRWRTKRVGGGATAQQHPRVRLDAGVLHRRKHSAAGGPPLDKIYPPGYARRRPTNTPVRIKEAL